MLKFLFVLCLLPFSLFSQTTQDELSGRVSESPTVKEYRSLTVGELYKVLVKVNSINTPKCVNFKFVDNSYKFVTSFDNLGNVCRVYDTSFLSLKTPIKVSDIPVMEFSSDDYLDWLQGNKEVVLKKIDNFKKNYNENNTTWKDDLTFERRYTGSTNSFYLSDLDLGDNLDLSDEDRKSLSEMVEEYGISKDDPLYALAQDPKSIFSKIKIDWDEVNKVYQVLLDFDFFPISGPVTLVDYKRPYSYIVNKIARDVIHKVISKVIASVPNSTTQRIVSVAIDDVFDFLEMTYDYHLNALEDTLRLNISGKLKTDVSIKDLNSALYIIYASRSSLLAQYLVSLITGQTFSLDKIEEIGRQEKFNSEKLRDSTRANLNSDLYWNKGCSMSLVHDYFGLCSKKGANSAVYSLLSERQIVFWSLGATPVYYFKYPIAVPLSRYVSWLLSIGARVKPLPINATINNKLVDILKSFSKDGMLDESYLINYYYESKKIGTIDNLGTLLLPTLYIQNFIPWIPKTELMEDKIVNSNRKLLLK